MSTSPLARGLRFALPLVAWLSALSLALRYGATRSYIGEPGKVNLVMQHRVDPEVAIFGASNAVVSFDARLIQELSGKTTFNLSTWATPFVQYQGLLREFATSSPSCRDVVLAETFLTFIKPPALMLPSHYLAYASNPTMYQALGEIDGELAWRARYVPFYSFIVADAGYYRAALDAYEGLLGRPPPDSEVQGFLAQQTSWQPKPLAEILPPTAHVEEEYAEVIALLNRNGKRVIVVVTPLREDCRGPLGAWVDLDAARDKLRSMVRAGDGNAFLDYSYHPIARDQANFLNCGHLNATGAAAFSRVFAHDLAALGR